MKKFLACILFGIASFAYAQTVTLDFTMGILADSGGTAISDASLFQVIASPDTTFGAPTNSSFVTGNDSLIGTWSFDSSTVGMGNGIGNNVFTVSTAYANQYLMIRWFPTLTTGSAVPGYGTSYGEYGYNLINASSWVAPSNGTLSYSMLTSSTGSGSLSNSLGYASQTTAVPEPATYGLMAGVAGLGLAFWRRRQVRA